MERQAEAAAELIAAARPDAAVLPLPWPTHGLGLQRALAEAAIPVLAVAHLAPAELEPENLAAAARPAPGADHLGRRVGAGGGAARGVLRLGGRRGGGGAQRRPRAARGWPAARRGAGGEAGAGGAGGPATPLFVFAGRLDPNKGADLLPAMAERLHAATGGGGIAVLGGGKPLRGWEAAADAPPHQGLHLMGHVRDVPDWLLAADALLLPSRLEGCPLVFLEAAARRCPVVATAAAVECFGDAAHAMAAVAQEGSAAAVADRALAAFAEPVATRRRVEAAYRHAVAHDAAAMLRQYAGLLRAAVAP